MIKGILSRVFQRRAPKAITRKPQKTLPLWFWDDTFQMERNAVITLPPGWTIGQVDSHPGQIAVAARTKSEARAMFKKMYGLKRLPPGARVERAES